MAQAKREEFDPIAEGQKEAKKNSEGVRAAVEKDEKVRESNIEDARKTGFKNAKLDDSRRKEARMEPQDVGTSERDIPEGAPVTDEPEESKGVSKAATSKDADAKKDLPDDKKVQDTNKDSATPSPSKAGDPETKALEEDGKSGSSKTAGKN